jgi:hypothetical protein
MAVTAAAKAVSSRASVVAEVVLTMTVAVVTISKVKAMGSRDNEGCGSREKVREGGELRLKENSRL